MKINFDKSPHNETWERATIANDEGSIIHIVEGTVEQVTSLLMEIISEHLKRINDV